VEERLKTVPPPKETIRWRRYVEAYGRTGMRLLRHAEADDGKAEGIPAYQLATLLACERRPNEALYWMQRAALAGHDHARQLTAAWGPVADSKPPGDWRPADVAHEIGLQYEATGQPFSAAVFFVRAAENGHAEAAYRAGLHNMQIGRPWDAMLMFSRAAGAGHEPALHELDGVLPRAHHVPTVAMLPYWLPENSTAGLALPVIPFDDRDAT
jgi:TPR repeat protein